MVYSIDFTIGKLLRHYYFTQKSGLLYRTTYAMEKTTDDILIFGSSRANHHYHPQVFETQLPGYSYYNAGRDGNSIFYNYAVLKSVLKRYKPKIIILDVEKKALIKDTESYDRLAALLPYYTTHPEIRPIIDLKSPYEAYKLLSQIYPFNSLMFTIAAGNTEMNKNRSADLKGYVPLSTVCNALIAKDTADAPFYLLDSNKVACLENFLKDCKENEIKVFLFVSPYFVKFSQQDYSVATAAAIAKKYGVEFEDFSKDTVFTSNHLLFADLGHLNNDGAKLYTNKVIERAFNK